MLDITKGTSSLQLVSSARYLILLVFQVPLFKELDDHFLRALSLRLVSYTICPNQLVVHASDLSTEMYLIRRCVNTFKLSVHLTFTVEQLLAGVSVSTSLQSAVLS